MDNWQGKLGKSSKLIFKKLTVYGMVQGIGFRPFVAKIAKQYKILGTVRNLGGFVEIKLSAYENAYSAFFEALKKADNIGAKIVKIDIENIENGVFDSFQIIDSEEKNDNTLMLLPSDLAVCEDCINEIKNSENRRYKHPFNSCVSCGPRYSIIEKVPYDRPNTTMVDFPLCEACEKEYTESGNRRHHAQTVSCNHCGPTLIYSGESGECTEETALLNAVSALLNGEIIAIKGIGGYHFACSPFFEKTVEKMRALKERDHKPFAVMFPSIENIKEYCAVSEKEAELLTLPAHPIVLLKIHNDQFAPSLKGNLVNCGCFLPYTPLQILLLKQTGALIMTSANLSEDPIIKDDAEVLAIDSPLLSGVLWNKRRIVRRVEDSVARVVCDRVQTVRMSRGYVPLAIPIQSSKTVLALGGDLKANFCVSNNGFAYVSEYFGDLENSKVFELYTKAMAEFLALFHMAPSRIAVDKHPGYHSKKQSEKFSGEPIYIAHHHAHIASVMAEHQITTPVIGVSFDGTGYGDDGNIWGGEFLICEGANYERVAHLEYTKIVGGDSASKNADKTAFCYLFSAGIETEMKDKSDKILKAAIQNNINTVKTSSMGRLFDAVSSILEIKGYNSYEGECAILLENEAVLGVAENRKPYPLQFVQNGQEVSAKELLTAIYNAKNNGVNIREIALGFHMAVCDMVVSVCEGEREKTGICDVALSGGVFQNALLLENVILALEKKGFRVFINSKVPPNDGGISLGQNYIATCAE